MKILYVLLSSGLQSFKAISQRLNQKANDSFKMAHHISLVLSNPKNQL